MIPVSRISPLSDAEAARLVHPATVADLAERIMSEPRGQASATLPPRRRGRAAASGRPRRWLIGVPVAAALTAAAVIATSLGGPGQKVGPVEVGPASAQAAALSFTRDGGYLDVIVRNPLAAPAVYRAEFAAHHLHITLTLVPASPSMVGTLVAMQGNDLQGLATITAKGRCWTGGGGYVCPVGVKVPVGYRGTAQIIFGRAARPGEQYESTGLVTASGEAMHGLAYRGRTVAAVLAMLRARRVTVPQYRSPGSGCELPHPIPVNWIVTDADPWAPGQVLLWVSPPGGQSCAPARTQAPAPQASPSPTSH